MYLTYLLQDRCYHLKVANVKDWQSEAYMAEVAIADLEWLAACLAKSGLVRYTHTAIKRAIGSGCPVTIQVIK